MKFKFHWRSAIIVVCSVLSGYLGTQVAPEQSDAIANSVIAVLSLIGVVSRKD